MTKVKKQILPSVFLDTLAQMPNDWKSDSCKGNLATKANLFKRARAKFITNCFVLKLVDCAKNENDKLLKSYWNTYHCTSELTQDGKKITAKYCNNRWCLVCNRIRTGKLINGYFKPLQVLQDKQFVTLTVVNIKSIELKKSIENMIKCFRTIQKKIQYENNGKGMIGIRKLECTYNNSKDTYHPHFHCIIEGKENSYKLRDYWLELNLGTTEAAQDVREANEHSVKELFKYFTKLLPSKKDKEQKVISVAALNNIFLAMERKRVFQSMGVKKEVSEDVADLESIIYEDLEDEFCQWIFSMEVGDWTKKGDEFKQLTNFSPNESIFKLLEKIK